MAQSIQPNYHSLITTGLTLGLLHVVVGPDHLSALAALSVGSSWRAFRLGFRWGVGHSTGLVVVAAIFIALKGDLDLRKLGRYCDSLVGMFMVGIGCYEVLGAIKVYKEKRNKRDHDLTKFSRKNDKNDVNGDVEMSNTDTSPLVEQPPSSGNQSATPTHRKRNNSLDDGQLIELLEEEHSHIDECSSCPFIDVRDPYTQRILSFMVGLLHGVAGPGGILGVLPAVEMQNWKSSTVYLGSFIFTSTLSMGTFAAIYGELTKRIGATAETVELGLSVLSSAMSIIVGTVWLVLSLLGKLEEVFH